MTDDLLTLPEAAALVGVSPRTMRRWAEAGTIRCITLPAGHRRIPRSEVNKLLKALV